MALNIKDPETEQLATDVAALTGENKTQAIRTALRRRKEQLELHGGIAGQPKPDLMALLETHVWPLVPPGALGTSVSRAEREDVLGYGPEGA